MLRNLTIAVIAGALLVCGGCQSQASGKKAAKERWDKTSAKIKLALAQQAYDNRKYDEAAKTVQQCITADPKMPEAHLLLGKLRLIEGRTREAAGELQLAVKLDEKLHEGWYWLGVAAEENRDYQRAYDNYEKALLLEPLNIDYVLAVAEVQVAQNNCSEAVKLLSEGMTALPRDVSLKVAAADLMLRVGRSDRAIDLYKHAMLMTSDNDDIAEPLGYCYLFSGKWAEASDIFDALAAKSRDEQHRKIYLQAAALCNMNSGRYDRALQCYGKLSVEQRDNAEIWVKMGQAALGAGMTKRALECGRKAIVLRPGYADAIAIIGCAQYVSGDYAAAARTFEGITIAKNSKGFSLLMKARCYEQLGETKRAKEVYRKALEANPGSELGEYLAKGKDITDSRLSSGD
ncbi:MAG TPA: tetratricopeptide repeat protein [Sedimentisphaerales bacterium]|nr:tetratricopeptide repeat protein [Sedimentisphaerales bacterium]